MRAVRERQGQTEFLVQWKGKRYSESWEPAEHLSDAALRAGQALQNEAVAAQTRDLLGFDAAAAAVEEEECSPINVAFDDVQIATKAGALRTVKGRCGGSGGNHHVAPAAGDGDSEQESNAASPSFYPPSSLSARSSTSWRSTADHAEEATTANQRTSGYYHCNSAVGVDDTHFDWSDAGHVVHQLEIERLDVTALEHADCAARVRAARLAGTPIVLTGHVGWAQFAAPWLKKCGPVSGDAAAASLTVNSSAGGEESSNNAAVVASAVERMGCSADGNNNWYGSNCDLLDLSKPHVVDVKRMVDDIGNEQVPILRKNYNEREPIRGHLSVHRFLRNCWPSASSPEEQDSSKGVGNCHTARSDEAEAKQVLPGASLYLHQWLFTASKTAVPKLCGKGKSVPLPNNILGDDLLRYWYNKEQCSGDSPYQYLFMGNAGTMSKLHRDSGGLLISIAPIVGQKEVILVHRDDGASSLYNLEASIEKPDMHRFPMLYSARVWRSTILPGEILLMPQGTYHQCCNVTPCLSYHRFHLDAVNLKAFFDSWQNEDAFEIEHEVVIWNAASELRVKVDSFVEMLRSHPVRSPKIPADIYSAVDSLRALHKVSREIAMKFELAADGNTDDATVWNDLVCDVGASLHDFRYRRRHTIPPFRHFQVRRESTETLGPSIISGACGSDLC